MGRWLTRLTNLGSIIATVSIVLTNKHVLDHFQNPFIGNLIVPLHLLCTVLVSRGYSAEKYIPGQWLVLNACVGVLSLYGSMLVLKYSTVSFQQVGRLLAVPVSAIVDRFYWRNPKLAPDRVICIIGILCGVLLASLDTVEVTLVAMLWNLVAVVGQVGSQTVVKILAQKFGVNSQEHLRQSAPYTFAVAIAALGLSWYASCGQHSEDIFNRVQLPQDLPFSIVLLIVLSCALGVSVQFMSTWLSQTSTAVSYALLSLTKSACAIGVGAIFFSETFSSKMLSGATLSLFMFYRFLQDGEDVEVTDQTHNFRQKRTRSILNGAILTLFLCGHVATISTRMMCLVILSFFAFSACLYQDIKPGTRQTHAIISVSILSFVLLILFEDVLHGYNRNQTYTGKKTKNTTEIWPQPPIPSYRLTLSGAVYLDSFQTGNILNVVYMKNPTLRKKDEKNPIVKLYNAKKQLNHCFTHVDLQTMGARRNAVLLTCKLSSPEKIVSVSGTYNDETFRIGNISYVVPPTTRNLSSTLPLSGCVPVIVPTLNRKTNARAICEGNLLKWVKYHLNLMEMIFVYVVPDYSGWVETQQERLSRLQEWQKLTELLRKFNGRVVVHTLPYVGGPLYAVDCIARHSSITRSLISLDLDEYLVFPQAPHDGVTFFEQTLSARKIIRIRWVNMAIIENGEDNSPAVKQPAEPFWWSRRDAVSTYCGGNFHQENLTIIDPSCSLVKPNNTHKWMASTDMSHLRSMPNIHTFIVKQKGETHGTAVANLSQAFIAHFKGLSRRYWLKDGATLPSQSCDGYTNFPSLSKRVISKLIG